MKTIKLALLKSMYETACNQYVQKFANKQGIEFDGWVGDEVGGLAAFNCEYFFNISEIVLDINTKQPKCAILNWQNDNVEFDQKINYKSYTMGLRCKDLK